MDSPTPSALRRLWRYAAPHRRQIARATVWNVLATVFDLAPPFLIGTAVDIAIREEDSLIAKLGISDPRDQVIALAIATFVIWALESLFEYLATIGWRNLGQTIQHELRMDAYSHVQHIEMAYFEDKATGELMSILNDDVNQLERFLDFGASDLIHMFVTVCVIGSAYFYLAPQIAWIAFLPVPAILWGSFAFQKRMEPRYAAVREQAGVINSQLSNNLAGITTIKAFTAEDHEVERIGKESNRYRETNRRAILLSSAFPNLIRIVIVFGFTGILMFGGFRALDGRLQVGAYSVMIFLTQRLLWPLTRLGQTVDLYQRAMASTNRVLDVLDTEATIRSGDTFLSSESVTGKITLDDIAFAYQQGFPVLQNLSIEIGSGETTALVGSTGSGKTTIVKLLLRFYDPNEGSVRLEGHDLRDLALRDLRSTMALVSQDVYLFHGSVLENIVYGRQDASLEDVRRAAEIAEAHEFVMELPHGYETMVGERGQKLSGGQRQRLSIARAILSNAPILILDEATSAVDNETEAAIQRSLMRISHERTTVVIAHRLSTIRHADKIYVLDRGEIAEDGTHDELVAAGGIYRSLWDVQTGESTGTPA